jgi:hypothetical protein
MPDHHKPEIVVPPGVYELHYMLCGCINRPAVWGLFRQHLERGAAVGDAKGMPAFTPDWYVVECLLDHIGLTEHGTSIRFAWITDKGREVLKFLADYGDGWADRTDLHFMGGDEVLLNPN